MRSEPLFKPGDVAVLKNANGGRLFTVYSVNGEKVTEETWASHQQPFALEVWCDQLVPVADKQAGEVLVQCLTAAKEKYDAKVHQIDNMRRQEYRSLYEAHRKGA